MAGSVTSQKFYSQYVNDTDFSANTSDFSSKLTGSIGDKIQAIHTISFVQKSTATTVNNFIVYNNVILCTAGDFLNENWKVGDEIELYDDATTTSIFSGRTITNVTSNAINFDGASLGSGVTYTDARLLLTSNLTGVKFYYNLIENSEPLNFVSKIDGTAENIFYADSLVAATPQTMTAVAGVKSWQTGEGVEIEFDGKGSLADDYEQTYTITHEFTILPFFLDGELTNLQNNTKPNLFSGFNTLKYVFKADLGITLSDADDTRKVEWNGSRGNVGWYNENLNGLAPNYTLTSVSYTDTDTGASVSHIQLDRQTTVQVIIDSSDKIVDNGDPVQLLVYNAVDQSAYQQNNNFIGTNFVLDRIFTTIGAAASASDFITDYSCTAVDTETLQVDFKVEYSAAQQALASGINSVIVVTPHDNGLTNDSSNRVAVLADVGENFVSADEPDLAFVTAFNIFPQDQDTSGTSYTNLQGWKEDGYIARIDFDVNTDLGGTIKSASVQLAAFNTTSEEIFVFDSVNFPMTPVYVVSGVQQFNIQQERSFQLPTGSDWNRKYLTYQGLSTNSGYNVAQYRIDCGMRLRYEDWIALNDASTDFLDFAEPNDGLNMDTSRYTTTGDWELVTILDLNIESSSKGVSNYKFITPAFESKDYDVDGNTPADWSGEISLFDADDNEISIVDADNDTKIVVTFDRSATGSLIGNNEWARIRAYKDGTTFLDAFEISTQETPKPNQILKPLSGETELKLTQVTSDQWTLEAMIDKNYITQNDNWYFSGRIGGDVGANPFSVIFAGNYYDHWDFNDSSTISLSGSDILSITSKGDEGNILSFVGTSPLLVTSVINGRDVARFDGVGDVLQVTGSTAKYNFMHDGSGGTIIIIAKPRVSGTGNEMMLASNSQGTPDVGFQQYYNDAGANTDGFSSVVHRGSTGTLSVGNGSGNNTFIAAKFNSVVSALDADNATADDRSLIYMNSGSLDTGNTQTNAPSVADASRNLQIGVRPVLGDWRFDGDIAEILIVDTVITPAQAAEVATLINFKYGTLPV